ncbi:MAG: PKD domain-containing protein, partial [Thermoplasmata archaeon]|nr:PKD domain-containing protein [Thermoplasmata archaeon]
FTPSLGLHNVTLSVETEDDTHKDWIDIIVLEATAEAVVSDVMFSPAEPVEGDVVRFTVTVGNDGTIDAEDVLVRLLDASGGLLAFAELTTPVSPGGTTPVTLEWEPGEGAHDLTVEVAADTEQVSIFVEENFAPLATISVVGLDEGDKAEFSVGERIHFVGLASDPEGETVTYEWNFGDGGTSDEVEPEHEYGKEGTFEVTVTVTDPRGASTTSTFELEVTDSATPAIGPFAVVMVLLVSALVLAVVRRRR